MIIRIFTFGYGQIDPLTSMKLDEKYVTVIADNLHDAQSKMLQRFGHRGSGFGNWAFDYKDKESAGVHEYNLSEIDFETGKIL